MEFAILSCCYFFHLSEPTERQVNLRGEGMGTTAAMTIRIDFVLSLLLAFHPSTVFFHSISALPLPALESRFLISHFFFFVVRLFFVRFFFGQPNRAGLVSV